MKTLMLALALTFALPTVAASTAQACPCSRDKTADTDQAPACGEKNKTAKKKDAPKKKTDPKS